MKEEKKTNISNSKTFWILTIVYSWIHLTFKSLKHIYDYYSVEHGPYCDLFDPTHYSFIKDYCKNLHTHPTNENITILYGLISMLNLTLIIILLAIALIYLVLIFNNILDRKPWNDFKKFTFY